MRPCLHAPLLALALCALVPAAPAVSHGPCDCLVPRLGKTESRVRITKTTAFKVIFNPTPAQYGAAMRDAGYASAYDDQAPTAKVVSRPRRQRRRNVRFRVPDVPPGLYLVLIFDGTEGGQHKTWEYYHVLGPPATTGAGGASTRQRQDDATTIVGVGVLGLIGLGIIALVLRGRDHHPPWVRRRSSPT